MTALIIRAAGIEQAEMLSDIHRQCFARYWNIEAFNDFFASAGTLALLAEMPEPVGIMVCRIFTDEAEIMTLAVRPGFRRQGIARALLEKTMETARSFGSPQMFLDVEDGNLPAIKLYETHGFSIINRRKQYYRQTDGSYTDALVMRRKL